MSRVSKRQEEITVIHQIATQITHRKVHRPSFSRTEQSVIDFCEHRATHRADRCLDLLCFIGGWISSLLHHVIVHKPQQFARTEINLEIGRLHKSVLLATRHCQTRSQPYLRLREGSCFLPVGATLQHLHRPVLKYVLALVYWYRVKMKKGYWNATRPEKIAPNGHQFINDACEFVTNHHPTTARRWPLAFRSNAHKTARAKGALGWVTGGVKSRAAGD